MGFNETIIGWYQTNKRELPWRNITDPYRIWLSEIILQQTRIDQGIDYYYKFVEAFPEIRDLAQADQEQVIKYWQGLGYYSRARNLHQCAQIIYEQFDGKFPETYQEVLNLPGIGPYTAAAIVSLAYGLPYPSVDGNVLRFISRCFGVDLPIDSSQGKKVITDIAGDLMDIKQAGNYNQALIEMGALICKPRNPLCDQCPVRDICFALKHNIIEKLPYKKGKTKVRQRYFNYLVIQDGHERILIKKRTEKDIWQNMYDFPLIESDQELTEEAIRNSKEWKSIFKGSKNVIKIKSRIFRHKLSHQDIHARFWEIEIENNLDLPKRSDYIKLNKANNIHQYPIPKLIENYCAENVSKYGKR